MPRREPQVKTGNLGALNATLDVNVTDLDQVAVFLTGAFVGTVCFSGSDNGTNFVPLVAVPMDSTTPGTPVAGLTTTDRGANLNVYPHKILRLTMSAYTSGTAAARVSGFTR